MLLKSRGFTAVAILSLALGIGANSAISCVSAVAIYLPSRRALGVEPITAFHHD